MKLLLLTAEHPGNLYGGLGTYIRDLSRILINQVDLKIVFFNLERKSVEEMQSRFKVDFIIAPTQVFPTHTFEGKALEIAASLQFQIDQIINQFEPDVIHPTFK